MRHDITLLAQGRNHTRMPNKRLRQRGLQYPRLSLQGLYQLLRHFGTPRTRFHEDFYLSSRGRTGNRNKPRDVLRQRLQMRLGVHRVHARIARLARLQDRETYAMVLESSSHCCDAGTGSYTGTE